MNIKRSSVIISIIVFIFIISVRSAETKEDILHNLNIKQVITNSKMIDNSDYESGKMLYPQYSYEGLPEYFMIKKTPNVSFEPNDIKLVEIIKEPWISDDMLQFTVNIFFNSSGRDKIYAYSKQNINKKVAIEIDSKILVIATILEKIENEMTVIINKKTAPTISAELRKVSNKIIIKEKGDNNL
jgi:preprotein translocase subunit SecD